MTLADLRRAAELLPAGASLTLPRDAVLAALAGTDGERGDVVPVAVEPERWIKAEECAALLNVTPRWVYDHAKELGGKSLSPRCKRFSGRAVALYLKRLATGWTP